MATGTGVEATAREAYEAGLNVTLAIDAMTDMRPENQLHEIARGLSNNDLAIALSLLEVLARRSGQK